MSQVGRVDRCAGYNVDRTGGRPPSPNRFSLDHYQLHSAPRPPGFDADSAADTPLGYGSYLHDGTAIDLVADGSRLGHRCLGSAASSDAAAYVRPVAVKDGQVGSRAAATRCASRIQRIDARQ